MAWFPNPVQDELCLLLQESPNEIIIDVYNQLGQRTYQGTGHCHQLNHFTLRAYGCKSENKYRAAIILYLSNNSKN